MPTFTTTVYDATTHQPVPPEADSAAYDTYTIARCDADGSRVTFEQRGTAEYASCARGHWWQQTFDPDAPGWRARS